MTQGTQDTDHALQCRHAVDEVRADRDRGSIAAATETGESRQRLDKQILSWRLACCALRIVGGQRAVNEPRVELRGVLKAEAEALHYAGPVVLDQHVGTRDQPPRCIDASGLLEVETEAALVAVGYDEIGTDAFELATG